MTNSLDSRLLGPGDCFGQTFPTPGPIRCYIVRSPEPAGSAHHGEDLLIQVAPKTSSGNGGPKQINVAVKSDGKGGLETDTARISLEAGDGVLFYTSDSAAGRFAVSGAGPNFHFDSSRIENGAVYTHVFGTPGRHKWSDIYNGALSGVVEVRDVAAKTPEDRSAWLETLKKPAAFEIKGNHCSPAAVEIVVGQTVFWSITDSSGIAITDDALTPSRLSSEE